MTISWTPDTSKPSTDLGKLKEVAAHDTEELKSCLQSLEDAKGVLKLAIHLHAIRLQIGATDPRFRHDRVEENIKAITSVWSSFSDWTAGQLCHLCLLKRQDVDKVVSDATFREVLRSRLPKMEVPKGFVDKIKRFNSKTSLLVQLTEHGRSPEQKRKNVFDYDSTSKRNSTSTISSTRAATADMDSFQDIMVERGQDRLIVEDNLVFEGIADNPSEDADDDFACLWEHAVSLPTLPDKE